jgi:hypothetical protein
MNFGIHPVLWSCFFSIKNKRCIPFKEKPRVVAVVMQE